MNQIVREISYFVQKFPCGSFINLNPCILVTDANWRHVTRIAWVKLFDVDCIVAGAALLLLTDFLSIFSLLCITKSTQTTQNMQYPIHLCIFVWEKDLSWLFIYNKIRTVYRIYTVWHPFGCRSLSYIGLICFMGYIITSGYKWIYRSTMSRKNNKD